MMRQLVSFWRDPRGAGAAEFALILPIALLFLLGLIDVGRYAWAFNQMEKSTQAGARRAIVTDTVPGVLRTYSFSILGGVPQGTVVPQAKFPGISCTSSGGTVSCACKGASSASGFCTAIAPDQISFNAIVERMNQIYPGVGSDNISIDYDWSGLGFAGDPTGPDVHPIVTVRINNLQFPMWFMLGRTVSLPSARYSITSEDGQGTDSY